MDYMTWFVVVSMRLYVTYAPVDVANIGSGMLNFHWLVQLVYNRQPGFGGCPKFARILTPSLC